MFLVARSNNDIYVYLVDPTDEDSLEAVSCVFGRPNRTILVLQGQYTQAQLREWYDDGFRDAASDIAGVTVTTFGIDELANRLSIGLTPRRGTRDLVEAELNRLGIPPDAVNINVGCKIREAGEGRKVNDSERTRQLLESLSLTLDVATDVSYGESLPMTFIVQNTSEEPVGLTIGGQPPFDFIVTEPDGTEVWHSLCGQIILASLGRVTLDIGEELEFTAVWEQVDNAGNPVPSGDYLVLGTLNMEHPDALKTEATTVSIRP